MPYFKSSTGERVDYNTGEKDLFNTAIDSSARSAYENAHGTSVADPNANRVIEDDELPSETSSVEESSEEIESLENYETSAHVTAATGVTGVNGGRVLIPANIRANIPAKPRRQAKAPRRRRPLAARTPRPRSRNRHLPSVRRTPM